MYIQLHLSSYQIDSHLSSMTLNVWPIIESTRGFNPIIETDQTLWLNMKEHLTEIYSTYAASLELVSRLYAKLSVYSVRYMA